MTVPAAPAGLIVTGLDLKTPKYETGGASTRLEMWPYWLQVSSQESASAYQARHANPGRTSAEFQKYLDEEMRRSMACVCSAAFAVEVFTNSVEFFFPRPTPVKPIKNDSAARHIHRTWDRAFNYSSRRFDHSSLYAIKTLFAARNLAVHSQAGPSDSTMHPELGAVVEPRQAIFRSENAFTAYRIAAACIIDLTEHPRPLKSGNVDADAEWLEWCQDARAHALARFD